MNVPVFVVQNWAARMERRASTLRDLTVVLVRPDGSAFTAPKRRTDVIVVPTNKFAAMEFASVNQAKEEATSAYANRFTSTDNFVIFIAIYHYLALLFKKGWTTDGASPGCTVDVDECAYPIPLCSANPRVQCINLPGSFRCGPCPAGYTGNGHYCADIDECQINNGGCSVSPRVQCTNTIVRKLLFFFFQLLKRTLLCNILFFLGFTILWPLPTWLSRRWNFLQFCWSVYSQ